MYKYITLLYTHTFYIYMMINGTESMASLLGGDRKYWGLWQPRVLTVHLKRTVILLLAV